MELEHYKLNTLDTFNLLIANAPKDLSHSEFRVLMNIFHHRNSHHYDCFPGYRDLAKKCACRQGTLSKCIKALEDKNYIVVCRNWNSSDSRRLSSQYWFVCELPIIHAAFRDEESSDILENKHSDVYWWYHKTDFGIHS